MTAIHLGVEDLPYLAHSFCLGCVCADAALMVTPWGSPAVCSSRQDSHGTVRVLSLNGAYNWDSSQAARGSLGPKLVHLWFLLHDLAHEIWSSWGQFLESMYYKSWTVVQAINDLIDFISFLPLTSNVIRLFGITRIYGMMTVSFGTLWRIYKAVWRCLKMSADVLFLSSHSH